MTVATRDRVAVVGSGVSGLTAAYLLQRRYDVSLYEAEPRLGGHAHTHDVPTTDAGSVAIDSGFIVHNERTYPHLLRLFAELDVDTQPTEMSMSISCHGCGLTYAGARGLSGFFATPRSATRPAYLRMLAEVKKFHRQARPVVATKDDQITLGDFLTSGRFSTYFTRHFMVPLVACVWSTSPALALDFPALYLFEFLDHHGMLTVTGSPQWRTVSGGSRVYVERATKGLTAVNLGTPVRTVTRHDDGVDVRDADDTVERFDRVVLATHADTALGLLTDAQPDERSVLGAFRYTTNETLLHTDERLLPRARRARASWNYRMPSCSAPAGEVLVSYDMNRLQGLPTTVPHVVSLNARNEVAPDRVLAHMSYDHPVYTRESVSAQDRLPGLTTARTTYAGAYHGWGFHEDGCRSGVAAAAAFGVTW